MRAQMMTWGDFIKEAEDAGVRAEDKIGSIDFIGRNDGIEFIRTRESRGYIIDIGERREDE